MPKGLCAPLLQVRLFCEGNPDQRRSCPLVLHTQPSTVVPELELSKLELGWRKGFEISAKSSAMCKTWQRPRRRNGVAGGGSAWRTLAQCSLLPFNWAGLAQHPVTLEDAAACVSSGTGTQWLLRYCLDREAAGVIIELNSFLAHASWCHLKWCWS